MLRRGFLCLFWGKNASFGYLHVFGKILGFVIVIVNKKSRGDPTRTGDHLVPNQVRYQLRYTPIACRYVAKSDAKIQQKVKSEK